MCELLCNLYKDILDLESNILQKYLDYIIVDLEFEKIARLKCDF